MTPIEEFNRWLYLIGTLTLAASGWFLGLGEGLFTTGFATVLGAWPHEGYR